MLSTQCLDLRDAPSKVVPHNTPCPPSQLLMGRKTRHGKSTLDTRIRNYALR